MRGDAGMRKSLILSTIIGGMSPYLPFWRFDNASDPVIVGLIVGFLTFAVLYPDEVVRKR